MKIAVHLLPAKRFTKQNKRNCNRHRFPRGCHGRSQWSTACANQRQHKLYAQVAGQTEQERISVRLNWVL